MAAFNLLDVLRQLDVSAVDRIFNTKYGWGAARLACTELRDFVDFNIRTAGLFLTWESSQTSLLARFRRCASLKFFGKSEGDGDIPHPSLLASWCLSGMGAQVARNVTVLSLEGALDLPTLTIVSLALAGALQHVHTLRLDTSRCGAGGFRNLYALHSALRGAFPALQELCLPAMACLRGLVAFAGSALHTVRVIMGSPGCLCQSHVRSLLRLSQLRHLDLDGAGWDAMWDDANDDDAWDALNADDDAQDDADEGIPAGADEELALGDATLEEALPGLTDEALQEMWALRRLLASTPPALESLRLNITFQEINFVDGRITRAVTSEHVVYRQHSLRFAAAALLPRLEATGQRLPLLKVEDLMELDPAGAISLLQPHTTFARLLAKCDRVELGLLELDVGSLHPGAVAAAAAPALQAVARAMGGGLPDQLLVRGSSWHCTLQMGRRQIGRCQRPV